MRLRFSQQQQAQAEHSRRSSLSNHSPVSPSAAPPVASRLNICTADRRHRQTTVIIIMTLISMVMVMAVMQRLSGTEPPPPHQQGLKVRKVIRRAPATAVSAVAALQKLGRLCQLAQHCGSLAAQSYAIKQVDCALMLVHWQEFLL